MGDLTKALKKVMEDFAPDRIIIEPSGVGKLSDVAKAVEKVEGAHIGAKVTVVDAGKCRMYMKNFGEFFLDQIKTANTIIFSRTQLLPPERVEKSRALVEEQHPGCRIITTPWDDLSADAMLEVIESGKPIELHLDDDDDDDDEHEHHHHHDHDHDEHCSCHDHEHHHDDDDDDHDHEHHHDHDHDGHDHEHHHENGEGCTCGCHDHDHDHEHHHHHHHADEVFVSVGVETARRYEQDEVKAMLDQLSDKEEYGQVLRAKGILQNAAGEWFQFDYVPGESQFRPGTADYTGRLCVIGAHIEEAALRTLFKV